MLQRHPRRRNLKARDSRGQALVEFSLVVVIFITVFSGILEFGVAFSVKMQISFASRSAAIVAAESGGSPATADQAILNIIDKSLMAPAARNKIDHVDIFWANASGGVANGAIERYAPGGVLYPGYGGWTRLLDLYQAANRCAFIGGSAAGCQTTPNHSGPDPVGVSIVYRYRWITPLPGLVGLDGNGMTFTQTNLSIMEPIPQ